MGNWKSRKKRGSARVSRRARAGHGARRPGHREGPPASSGAGPGGRTGRPAPRRLGNRQLLPWQRGERSGATAAMLPGTGSWPCGLPSGAERHRASGLRRRRLRSRGGCVPLRARRAAAAVLQSRAGPPSLLAPPPRLLHCGSQDRSAHFESSVEGRPNLLLSLPCSWQELLPQWAAQPDRRTWGSGNPGALSFWPPLTPYRRPS